MKHNIRRILIANRGEIALRILRACKEMQIESVLVYSEADADSLPVKYADISVCIGPANPSMSYLNFSQIITVATLMEVDAIHPGYGFLSENATFATICQDYGLLFVGPTPDSLINCSNKAHVRSIAKSVQVPILPGTEKPLQDIQDALRAAESIGYPLLLKASMGGGGRGIRRVDSKQQLTDYFPIVQRESFASFGSDEIYMEKLLLHPRHIEVQIFGDGKGNVIHLGTRECSIQRKHQKIIEESPTCGLRKEKESLLVKAAVCLGEKLQYKNAGTCEFITDNDGNFYFLEINTRIQVEHPVTEETTGIDIVKMQIQVAQTDALPLLQSEIHQSGWAMEFRIVAENPETFVPCAGKIDFVHFPAGRGVRMDSHVYSGYVVPASYDSLLAKMIIHGANRKEVLTTAKRALQEFTIQGVQTNIPLLLKVLEHPEYQKGSISTSFLEQYIL